MRIYSCMLVIISFLTVLTSAYWVGDPGFLLSSPDDPEPKLEDRTYPPDDTEEVFVLYTAGALQTVDNVLAGRAEFPFIVDVRLLNKDQEDWTVGNLMNHKNVLVTCRWSNFYLKMTREKNVDWSQLPEKNRWIYNNPELVVYYAPLYLNEQAEQDLSPLFLDKTSINAPNDDLRAKVGTRSVKFISSHPKCEVDPINFDFSVLTLSREIQPLLPYISYMPIRIEKNQLLITDFDLSNHEYRRIVCYVASFGRNYRNERFESTNEYKVKYRVYYEDWAECTFHYRKYKCSKSGKGGKNPGPDPDEENVGSDDHLCPGPLVAENMDQQSFGRGFENLMCFNARARVGAICDHDNGAPLVCDGKVFGVVARGVRFNFCNDVLPVPFVVIKITPAADYYVNLARKPLSFNLRVDAKFEHESFATEVKASSLFSLLSATVFLHHVRV